MEVVSFEREPDQRDRGERNACWEREATTVAGDGFDEEAREEGRLSLRG